MAESKSESKEFLKPPFSAYDFFGYLIPAFVFLVCIYLFELAAKAFLPAAHLPLQSVFKLVSPEKEGTITQATLLVGMVLAAYVCGHVIATISSVLLDRVLIAKAHGYPSENLFLRRVPTLKGEASQGVYRGAFFWGNFFAWAFVVMVIFNFPQMANFCAVALIASVMIPAMLYLAVKYCVPQPDFAPLREPIAKLVRGYAYFYNKLWNTLNLFF